MKKTKYYAASSSRTLIVLATEPQDAARELCRRAIDRHRTAELGEFICVNEVGFFSPPAWQFETSEILNHCGRTFRQD